jgi:hypothetical protein
MSSAYATTQFWGGPGEEVIHTFSINDVQGSFEDDRFVDNPNILCSDTGLIGGVTVPTCPAEIAPMPATGAVDGVLYPLNSEFGFDVYDFAGATEKTLDPPSDFAEGWVGNYEGGHINPDKLGVDDTGLTGLMISNADTALFKAPAKTGTWCAGLGGTSVKCSTEHYVVLEHVLTCNEVNPYSFAVEPPVTDRPYAQGELLDPNAIPNPETFSCSDAALDDSLNLVQNGVMTPIDSGDPGDYLQPDENFLPGLPANESTIRNDIAVGNDYSITRKDDGKPLYRWGNLVKRPTDVRVYASMPLPAEWKQGQVYNVSKAELRVRHWITNNPNDQIRAEDMENEGATGLLPEYVENPIGVWRSAVNCYEGDGDYVTEETGGTSIGEGTLFKNDEYIYAGDSAQTTSADPAELPYPYSSDLTGGYTNAWYTTVDREPFEWWYIDPDDPVNPGKYYSYPDPNEAAAKAQIDDLQLQLVSGPRWRLKAPKYGQDLPGVEMGVDEEDYATNPGARPGCQAPPIKSEDIKYQRGMFTTTVINLLDWNTEEDGPSPLSTTAGWVDASQNVNAIVALDENGNPVAEDDSEPATGTSVNGAPLTPDFDLVVYVKGDKKPTVIYDAQLYVEWNDVPLVRVPYDFNANGVSDVLIRNVEKISFIEAIDGVETFIRNYGTDWTVAGIGYFNGDDEADALMQKGSGFGYMASDGTPGWIGTLATGWVFQGVGDFNGDEVSDLLVRKGQAISYLQVASGGVLTPIRNYGTDWTIVGIGYFNGDNEADILLQRGTTDIGFMASDGTPGWIGTFASGSVVEGTGDLNGDGIFEVIYSNGSSLSYLVKQGGSFPIGTLPSGWTVQDVGNYDSDINYEVLISDGNSIAYMEADGEIHSIATLNPGWVVQP